MLPQLDKLSTSWLLSLPGPHSGLSSSIFSEAVCKNLCLPSPACRGRVGELIDRCNVDQYGDNVMAAQLKVFVLHMKTIDAVIMIMITVVLGLR